MLRTLRAVRPGTFAICGGAPPYSETRCPNAASHSLMDQQTGVESSFVCLAHVEPLRAAFAAGHVSPTEPTQPAFVAPLLHEVCADVVEWQRRTFPGRTLTGACAHLTKEVDEIRESARDLAHAQAMAPGSVASISMREHLLEELADAVFLILQAVEQADCEDPTRELAKQMAFKLAQNRRRAWQAADSDGCIEHVRGEKAVAS